MINRRQIFRLADAFLVALLISGLEASGLLDYLDYNRLSDKFYQRRDVAKAISYLNNHDPNARPAVIGLDVLFTGENSADPEGDKLLVAAAAQYGNVVVGSEADFDEADMLEEKIAPYTLDRSWKWIPPFPAFEAVCDTGHIDAPNEEDGITRHELLYVNVEECGRLYSFARVIYEKYCLYKGLEPNEPPTTPNGLYYLPFTAQNYVVKNNFYDLLAGNVPAEVYRDKIVLIGPYAQGLQDSFPTALDRTDWMYGVDVHANSIQAFQKGFFPTEANPTAQLVVLFILSFVSEFFFRGGKMKRMIIWQLSIFFGWLALCQIFYRQEVILHVLFVPLAVTILFIAAVATNYILEREEKELVKKTFGRYVDPVIMNQLLLESSKLDLGGELQNIAVLFVDIRGFTSMSEELEPATVVEILNRYLTLTTECIRKHHGTLDKFVGDCTMAFWNAPLRQENPVLLASMAALDMIKGSEDLGKELLADYGRKISFGVRIHWESAIVGNIGTPYRMDYTAIGDTVNTAARLEANARGGKILISRAVADILGSRAQVTSLGNSIKLKGKAEDFEILELNGLN